MSGRLQSRAPSWASEDILWNRAARRGSDVVIPEMATVLGAKVGLVLLIGHRIRARALELF